METAMCRICLVDNSRLYPIVNTNLQLIYEKISECLFVAESKPLVVCYLCHSRLKSSYQLMMRCCQSEQILTQMLMEGEDHIDKKQNSWFNNLSVTPVSYINITQDTIDNSNSAATQELLLENSNSNVRLVTQVDNSETRLPVLVGGYSGEGDGKDWRQDPKLKSQVCVALKEIKVEYGGDEEPSSDHDEFDTYTEPFDEYFDNQTSTNTTVKHESEQTDKQDKKTPALVKTAKNTSVLKKKIQDIKEKNSLKKYKYKKTRYSCDQCHKRFGCTTTLKAHLRIHSDENPYQCDYCHRFFKYKSLLREHIQKHMNEPTKHFQCHICEMTFTKRRGIVKHIRKMHVNEKKRYPCDFCPKIFTQESFLKTHRVKHTDEKPFQCDHCQKYFKYKGLLVIHVKRYMNKSTKPYQCHICGKRFAMVGPMNGHIELVHLKIKKKRHPCDLCPKTFAQNSSLVIHKLTHTGETTKTRKTLQCDKCPKRFVIGSVFNRHLSTHTSEKPFKCDMCPKAYKQKEYLKSHRLSHNGGILKRFECDKCHMRFIAPCALRRHLNSHTGEKPFECGICHKRLADNVTLKNHIALIHNGVTKYQCHICQKYFGKKLSLTAHLLIHTGEKNFQCEICSKTFFDTHNLKKHMFTHTKPFTCDFCGKGFSRQLYLNTHIKKKCNLTTDPDRA